jgi:hypothetical protein
MNDEIIEALREVTRNLRCLAECLTAEQYTRADYTKIICASCEKLEAALEHEQRARLL